MQADVLIVGSGASATSAAFPLVRAGLSVHMLDVGLRDTRYAPIIPDLPFSKLRQEDPDQHRYFLGDEFEGIPLGKGRVGTVLTPPRQFIYRDTAKYAPLQSTTFFPFESLAQGGLASGWGAVAVPFDDQDLADFPIKHRDLAAHYDAVSARIGISGARDDLLRFYGDSPSLQPPLDLDTNAKAMLARYEGKREQLHRAGLYLGRARLAALSQDLGDRRAQRYLDMDFYADRHRSVFRPAYAVEELKAFSNFTYAAPYLAERFRELPEGAGVEIQARHTENGRPETLRARRLVLAAGALGTARIVLRSLERYDTPVPIVANANAWFPCVHLAGLGRAVEDRRHSMSQLGIVYDPDHTGRVLIHGQTYSYRSLLLFKLAKESFLPVAEGVRILREFMNAFVVVNVFHEDRPSPDKYVVLRPGPTPAEEVIEAHCKLDPALLQRQRALEKGMLRELRRLGCWAVGRVDPGYGTSIHYGCSFPMTEDERPLTVTPSCRLRGTRNVYLADASVLPYVPAKALTLTLMANAARVATALSKELAG